MSQVTKCDITDETNVPMLKVNMSKNGIEITTTLAGEKLNYAICITNQNGNAIKDVSEKYVLNELHGLTLKRLNEINAPKTNEAPPTQNITEL